MDVPVADASEVTVLSQPEMEKSKYEKGKHILKGFKLHEVCLFNHVVQSADQEYAATLVAVENVITRYLTEPEE